MQLELTSEQESFRQEVYSFLQEKLPPDTAQRTNDDSCFWVDDVIAWQKVLYEKGWVAPNWPVEYGGTGWTPIERFLFDRECSRAGAPPLNAFNFDMVGPVIYTFGNEAQKERFLPPILKSEVFFCQGYSEPNAGSDLAAVQMAAVRDGDDYIVNGTKMWTTFAQHADWIFCLVRTGEPGSKNQEAISFLLMDLATPGTEIVPIITVDGEHEVNQVFFDDVRVPVTNRIGDENKGWRYAKSLLQHERTGHAFTGYSARRLEKLRRVASETSNGGGALIDDPYFAGKLADVEVELSALQMTELRVLSAVSTGQAPGAESSILKLIGTAVVQAIDELTVEAAGYYSLPFVRQQFETGFDGFRIGPGMAANSGPRYFNDRKMTVYGGSDEVQKNIISKHVLGL
jgi:alkylation response protein AidB-like acyl-CoA dehydrogenase